MPDILDKSNQDPVKNYKCAKEFYAKNVDLIEKIAEDHPEYFVDESIVREMFSDKNKIEKIIKIDAETMKKNNEKWDTFWTSKDFFDNKNSILVYKINHSDSFYFQQFFQ